MFFCFATVVTTRPVQYTICEGEMIHYALLQEAFCLFSIPQSRAIDQLHNPLIVLLPLLQQQICRLVTQIYANNLISKVTESPSILPHFCRSLTNNVGGGFVLTNQFTLHLIISYSSYLFFHLQCCSKIRFRGGGR